MVAKGAAWTTPVLLTGVVAPAFAASIAPGLQGWVSVGKDCNQSRITLSIDGTGSYPDRGLWVYNAPPGQVSNAYIQFYYPVSLGVISWVAESANRSWSVPVVDLTAPSISGYTAYTTSYSGNWRSATDGGQQYSYAIGQPDFTGTVSNGTSCSTAVSLYARRTVTVNSQVIAFQRGPVTLGAPQQF